MKPTEELSTIKEDLEAANKQCRELTKEEHEQVTGGISHGGCCGETLVPVFTSDSNKLAGDTGPENGYESPHFEMDNFGTYGGAR